MKEILRIIRYSSKLWKLYTLIGVLSVLVALLNQAAPLLTKQVIDGIVAGLNGASVEETRILVLVILIFASDVGATLVDNISGYYGDMMGVRLQKILAGRYYRQILKLPQSYYDKELTGAIINRLNRGVTDISTFMNMFANNMLQFALTTIFTLAIISYYSWEVALMLGVLYPIFLWMTRRTSAAWQVQQSVINKNSDAAGGRFAEVVGQIRVVKSFVREKFESGGFDRYYNNIIKAKRKQSRHWHLNDVYRRLVLNTVFFMVYGYVVWQTVRGRFTVGEMVLLLQYSALIRIPIFSMSFLVDNTQKAIANSRDYFAVMELRPSIEDAEGAKALRITKGLVEFNNVAFSYQNDEPVLHDINFKIPTNSRAALVGESGQGKTTISNLLLRLYEPTRGEILIDSQDITKVKLKTLREQIGVVFQESALFSGTVSENIAYGKPGAKRAQIIKAARAANAHEFIGQFPKGYDTQIGEKGLRLSGGQKQRIAIARAILKDPPILILDEATSSLDSKAEVQVQQALERLMTNRTTLIIAHRLSTIKDADLIIGIKSGRVAEIGPPEMLAKKGGIYAELLHLQTSSLTTRKKRLKDYDLVTA